MIVIKIVESRPHRLLRSALFVVLQRMTGDYSSPSAGLVVSSV